VERIGLNMTIHGIKRGLIVLGVISGVAAPSARTFRNLDFFMEQFREAGAQALLIPGDVGQNESQMTAVLERLAKAPVPILVTPGAQENFDVFRRVMQKKRTAYPQLVDMTRVRRVRLGHISIVSLPGYYKPFYLFAGERGCGYREEDLKKTTTLFNNKGPTVLLAPSPPRGTGEGAVDRGRGGINIGDPALFDTLESGNISFGIFGHVYESGGHATHSDGRTPVAPGIWHQSLFVQAGSAEALPTTLVGEGRSSGMAQIVEFSAARSRFRTLYAPEAHTPAPANTAK
jgi:Icc-related predicted phosphoesterase